MSQPCVSFTQGHSSSYSSLEPGNMWALVACFISSSTEWRTKELKPEHRGMLSQEPGKLRKVWTNDLLDKAFLSTSFCFTKLQLPPSLCLCKHTAYYAHVGRILNWAELTYAYNVSAIWEKAAGNVIQPNQRTQRYLHCNDCKILAQYFSNIS